MSTATGIPGRISLVWLGTSEKRPNWGAGPVLVTPPTPSEVNLAMAKAANEAEFVCTWDEALGRPDPDAIRWCSTRPGDVWHAGLDLGLAGEPVLMDFIQPTWALARDPDPAIEATSWRVSLRACLARSSVIRRLGGPRGGFSSLEGASLELGLRWLMLGALVRHVPRLVLTPGAVHDEIPLHDQVCFAVSRFGRGWAQLGLLRAISTRACSVPAGLRGLAMSRTLSPEPEPDPIDRELEARGAELDGMARVSVIIPTIERYPYLRTVLDQLRQQTVQPHEVFVIDQTPIAGRDHALETDFADLPLTVILIDEPGQCTARNAALRRATGTHFLFLDDDVEIQPDLTERHLRSLEARRADVSCGVMDEVGALPLPPEYQRVRASDVFPTCNSMVLRRALVQSGLFDLAFDRGQRADGELGVRLSGSGALMVLDGRVSVLHHHAPRGGLRVHKARAVTYASSRTNLWHRNVPTVSDLYLWFRHYSVRQVREAMWIAALGTLAGRGTRSFRATKALIGLVLLPDTFWKLRRHARAARAMLSGYPQIPTLEQRQSGVEASN